MVKWYGHFVSAFLHAHTPITLRDSTTKGRLLVKYSTAAKKICRSTTASSKHVLANMLRCCQQRRACAHGFDFTRSIDYVNHNMLVAKLVALALPDITVRRICTFLRQRGQCVKIGDILTDWLQMSVACHRDHTLAHLRSWFWLKRCNWAVWRTSTSTTRRWQRYWTGRQSAACSHSSTSSFSKRLTPAW